MIYIIFPDMDAFDLWHANVMISLGLPAKGVNAATGEETEDYVTTAYTTPIPHPSNDTVACITEVAYVTDGAITYTHEDMITEGYIDDIIVP